MIARYVPARMGGFMMGAYFVASGVSQYLGGVVASYASVPQDITDRLLTLPIYTALFNRLGIAALVCTLIAIARTAIDEALGRRRTVRRPQSGIRAPPAAYDECLRGVTARRAVQTVQFGLQTPSITMLPISAESPNRTYGRASIATLDAGLPRVVGALLSATSPPCVEECQQAQRGCRRRPEKRSRTTRA